MDIKHEVKLYLAGMTPENQNMILRFKDKLNEEVGHADYTLTVVDVLEHPEVAQTDEIFATPTVVQYSANSIKKFILDLNDSKSMAIGVDMIKQEQE